MRRWSRPLLIKEMQTKTAKETLHAH
jgi:hypothetical protein